MSAARLMPTVHRYAKDSQGTSNSGKASGYLDAEFFKN
jgi:hypothetical protein